MDVLIATRVFTFIDHFPYSSDVVIRALGSRLTGEFVHIAVIQYITCRIAAFEQLNLPLKNLLKFLYGQKFQKNFSQLFKPPA